MPAGCKQAAKPQAQGPQALPVQVQAVSLAPVPETTDYVATIKSRRSVTLMPQVSGNLTQLLVKSGDHVKAGQVMLTIDPLRQQALVDAQIATERQKKALYDYNTLEIDRQRKLFEAGVTSRDALDQAEQSYQNTKSDWQAAVETRKSLEEQLAYYRIKAPFDGTVGDIPVHLGDYVTPATALTTVDENADLEAYIYLPTERSSQVKLGLPVEILDAEGKPQVHTAVNFLSPQVDNGLQGILAKAPIPASLKAYRTGQLINVRIGWNSALSAVIPVLAVTRIGGQTFVYVASPSGGGYTAHQVAVTLGDTVGNNYPVLSGLKAGDKVILSSIQYLAEGVPVRPLG